MYTSQEQYLQVNDDNVVQDATLIIKVLIFVYSAIFRINVVQSGWPSKRSSVNSDYTFVQCDSFGTRPMKM